MNKSTHARLKVIAAAGPLALALQCLAADVPADSMRDDKATLEVEQAQLDHLSKADFHPNLLPVILRNSDFIGLSDAQIQSLREWRKTNFRPMLEAMNRVLVRMIEFQEAALTASESSERLRAMQDEIFTLQRTVLDYKLSCRENIVSTFTREQWDNFYIVLSDTGYNLPVTDSVLPAAGTP
ncbi:MAG: hypothetical protein R3308_04195 [Thiohalobacterales bacterium]|nr:hypothetical protein [Thiohalobacterales bacterium]